MNRVTEREVIRYGTILTDDCFYQVIDKEDNKQKNIRIRTFWYCDDCYYHKMENGDVVDFRKLEYKY